MGMCAVITGASRGIGAAIAERLSRDGFDIIVNYNSSAEAAAAVADSIREGGGRAEIFRADVSHGEEAKALINYAVQAYGGVYALINNAGVTRDGLIARMSEDDWDTVMDVNLKSAYNCARFAAPVMMKKREGRIVNISSVIGLMGQAGQSNYAAAKAGLIGLTKSLARELAPRGITVNALAPGFIETDMTRDLNEKAREAIMERIPLKRFADPGQVAEAAAFFVSPCASYITGQTLAVDGGLTMA